MRAGLYARVSSQEQAEGYSLEQQLDAMRRFCRERGWTVAAEFVEPGASGTTGERPALEEALGDCEAGRLGALLTHQLDRFYRNLRLQLTTMEQLERQGVVYVSVVESIDFSTPHGKLVASIMGSINEYFVENLRRETRKGKQGRAKSGLSNTNIAPHGYDRVEGRDIIDEASATAVRFLFEQYATGAHSYQTAAELMNREGYPGSKRSRAGRWATGAVWGILQNRFYIGEVKYTQPSGKVDWYPGQHEPIIERNLWDSAQEVRARRSQHIPRRIPKVYLLQGLAQCHHCGCTLWVADKGGLTYYWDSARRRAIDCRDGGRHVRAAVMDAQVAALVGRLQLPADWRERLEELATHRDERERVEGRRQYLAGKLRRLRELYVEGDFSRPEYDRRKANLQAELDVLRMPKQSGVEEAGEALESLGAEWANAPLRHQRDMLRVIFDVVYVDVLEQKLICVRPFPPFVPLFRMDGLEEREDGCFCCKEDEEAGSES